VHVGQKNHVLRLEICINCTVDDFNPPTLFFTMELPEIETDTESFPPVSAITPSKRSDAVPATADVGDNPLVPLSDVLDVTSTDSNASGEAFIKLLCGVKH
jgi:hypothetical protein